MSVKGQGQYLILARIKTFYSVFKIKTSFCQKLFSHLEPKFHKCLLVNGMKIYTNELDQMTKIDAMPTYGNTLKIFFSRTNTLRFGM